jgi:chaperonin GroEL (HSP60 family)
VALEIELIDPIENMGVRLLREAASQIMADVGDGTISTLLLTQSVTAA